MPSTDTVRNIPISDVRDRASDDTRKLDLAHVIELAESIGGLGLLEPLPVDAHLRLLGGLNRRHACRLLAMDDAGERRAAFVELAGEQQPPGFDALADRVAAVDRAARLSRHAGGAVPVRVVPINSARAKDEALRIEVAENEKRRDYNGGTIPILKERVVKVEHEGRVDADCLKTLAPGHLPKFDDIVRVMGKQQF